MTDLKLNKITGFEIINDKIPVEILDYRGIPFYDNNDIIKPKYFNLPEGEYKIKSGEFIQLNEPIKYHLNSLPPFERKFDFPTNFEIIFDENPAKGTIFWKDKIILFDEKLKDLPLPELYFMLFHEFAHAKYKTEKYVDRLAENMMLEHGFNPTQTALAPINSLSTKQYERKKDALDRHLKRKL